MFDVGPSELLLIVVVAVVVIGPKDLPRALYKIGQVIGKAKGMARHFRTGVDAMIREAELDELQKQWAKENERIMAATAIPELDGTMTPLTDETGQPIDKTAQLPSPGETPAAEAADDAAPDDDALLSDEAASPDQATASDASSVADVPEPETSTPEEIRRAAAMPDQPRLPLDVAPDGARGGSSAS